jgi:hypothetical protein
MMTIQIIFDAQVQQKIGGSAGQTVTAATTLEALYQVARQHPSLRLFNCEGEMRSVYKIFRENAPLALDAPVQEGDTVLLSLGAAR